MGNLGIAQGFLGFLIITTIITILSCKFPKRFRVIIFLGFFIRLFAVFFHHFVISLPNSGQYAVIVEEMAWELAQKGFFSIITNFDITSSYYVYANIIAIPYFFLGRSLILAQLINVFLGTLIIISVYKLTSILWNKNAGFIAGFLVAISPSAINFSAITHREVFFVFFLLSAVIKFVEWVEKKSLKKIFLGLFFLFISATFHIGSLVIIIPLGVLFLKDLFGQSNIRTKLKSYVILTTLLFLGFILFVFNPEILPKIGWVYNLEFQNVFSDPHPRLLFRDDAYKSFLVNNGSLGSTVFVFFFRMFEFLFRPYFWESMTDRFIEVPLIIFSISLMFLFKNIFKYNFKLKMVLIFLIFLVIVFSLGSQEVIQGYRHRAKLVPLIYSLAAPIILKIRIGLRLKT